MENNKTNSSNDNDWKAREIGALWKKAGKTQNYFSGKVNVQKFQDEGVINIVGFSNKNKKEYPNSPDVILYFSPSTSSNSPLDLNENKKSVSESNSKEDVEETSTEETSTEESFDEESESIPF
jgi:hypothetical protein